MRHLTAENLLNYLDKPETTDKSAVENHLGSCVECVGLHQELQQLVNHLRSDSVSEPPSELVKWGIELFQPVMQPSLGGRVRKIVAALVFDTFEQPALAGMRRECAG